MDKKKKQQKKYRSKIIDSRAIGKNSTETTIKFTRFDKTKQLDVDELHELFDSINKKLPPKSKIMVRAMNGQRFFTFKSYDRDSLDVDSFEDYYINSVRETDKFEMFSQIQITILKQNFV